HYAGVPAQPGLEARPRRLPKPDGKISGSSRQTPHQNNVCPTRFRLGPQPADRQTTRTASPRPQLWLAASSWRRDTERSIQLAHRNRTVHKRSGRPLPERPPGPDLGPDERARQRQRQKSFGAPQQSRSRPAITRKSLGLGQGSQANPTINQRRLAKARLVRRLQTKPYGTSPTGKLRRDRLPQLRPTRKNTNQHSLPRSLQSSNHLHRIYGPVERQHLRSDPSNPKER